MRPQGQMSGGGPLPSGPPRQISRKGDREAHETRGGGASALPRWESFPSPDRRRLVGLLIQAARRQMQPVPTGPTGRVGRAGAVQG
jgi:hypothetical protein